MGLQTFGYGVAHWEATIMNLGRGEEVLFTFDTMYLRPKVGNDPVDLGRTRNLVRYMFYDNTMRSTAPNLSPRFPFSRDVFLSFPARTHN